jgi:3-hydroxy-D-aspartate aldolase
LQGQVNPGHAVTLAKQIAALPNLRFVGVQGYAGHAQHLATFEERKKAARRSAERLRAVATALTEAGLKPGFVSGGGTGTANIDMREGRIPICRSVHIF